MSDNEKLEKENEQFSSAILYVATAVYVGVCAMVFGALYAKLPSFGDAFLEMMKDYGTIITGIPVLVAVVVAKQQLDANRKQHVATIKRSLKTELDALDILSDFAQAVLQTSVASASIVAALASQKGIYISRPSKKYIDSLDGVLSDSVTSYAAIIWSRVGNAMDASTKGEKFEIIEDHLRDAQLASATLLNIIGLERLRLSKYWS
ncbi:hypothetical protein [Brucella pseudintermedia]|uniref:hypothetical protein n=1 Tax=Brucella pseudintermedia TaxID=370111 RepID=UPI00124BFADC|nr:hypothetical protein [Brucella pseudintermedia]KAB2679753.1 hypothetical protein F9K78_19195 [Brucella pseudintermedia]